MRCDRAKSRQFRGRAGIGLVLLMLVGRAGAETAMPNVEGSAPDTRHHPTLAAGVGGAAADSDGGQSYSLTLCEQGRRVRIAGVLELGVSRDLAAVLDRNPQVAGVMLDSPGGHVYEGRGLSRLFSSRGLDTYVRNECNSSCATAFIGGANRYLARTGRLGFHRYRFERGRLNPFSALYDVETEQRKDRALYAARNVGADFLERMFNTSHASIHFPGPDALLKAGVVTHLIEAADARIPICDPERVASAVVAVPVSASSRPHSVP